MKCPNCKTELILSQETRKYETLNDHVCDPNGESPERFYFYCPNENCILSTAAFWDDWGDFFSLTDEGEKWVNENHIDVENRKTHKRKGCEAIGSGSAQCQTGFVRDNRGLRRIRNNLRRKWGNWGIRLRRNYDPRPRSWEKDKKHKWYQKLIYSFGVWIMDMKGSGWKFHVRFKDVEDCREDWCLTQWLHHPYPWVRWQLKSFLAGNDPAKIVTKN